MTIVEERDGVIDEKKEEDEKTEEDEKNESRILLLENSLEEQKRKNENLEKRLREAEIKSEKFKAALQKTVETNAALSRGESDVVRKYISEILSCAEEDKLSVRHLMAVQASVRSRRNVWSQLESNIASVGSRYGLSEDKKNSSGSDAK